MRMQISRFLMCPLSLCVVLAASAAAAQTRICAAPQEDRVGGTEGPSPYVAKPVPLPKSAPYLLPDGSIYIAGNDLIEPLMDKLNTLFIKAHPEFKFTMDMKGSGEAISGITSTKSAFGPIARDVAFPDKDAFASLFGYQPTSVQIGWDNTPDSDHYPPGKFPPTIWVNAKNPISALTLDDLSSILLTGTPRGDITRWGQIAFHEAPIGNNGGDWAKREIHVYLPALRGLPVLSTGRLFLGTGEPWTSHAEYLPQMEDVVNAVANDPFGIGFTGWFPVDEGWDRQVDLGKNVRLLPLESANGHVSRGGPGDLYPLSGGLSILINRAPGQPVEPWIREYIRLALSRQGQEAISSMTKSDGFLPLDPAQIPREFQKVNY